MCVYRAKCSAKMGRSEAAETDFKHGKTLCEEKMQGEPDNPSHDETLSRITATCFMFLRASGKRKNKKIKKNWKMKN